MEVPEQGHYEPSMEVPEQDHCEPSMEVTEQGHCDPSMEDPEQGQNEASTEDPEKGHYEAPMEVPEQAHYEPSMEDPNEDQNCQILFIVEKSLSDFILSFMNLSITDEMIASISNGHLNIGSWSDAQNKSLLEIFRKYKSIMGEVAEKNFFFQSLTPNDQTLLLERNQETFLMYIMARYFSSPTGFDQLAVLFGPKMPRFRKNFKLQI